MALIAKNKLCFVDGTISKLSLDDDYYNSWSRCNSMVMSWILHAVSREIADSIMYIDNAESMWNDLHDRFHQSNGPRVFQIKQLLNVLYQGADDVNGYFTKLKTLWDELKDFRPIPSCNCGGMKALMDYQQQDYVLQFLMGLNESFAQIRAQILMQDPLPPINKVFSLVVQEERQRILTSSSISDSASFAVNAGSSSYSRGKYDNRQYEKPTCAHCGYLGHTIDKCYKLHGYPPGFKFRNSNSMGNTGKYSPVTQNRPMANQTGASSDQGDDSTDQTSSVSTLSSSQCQQLIALLSTQLSSTSPMNNEQQPVVSNFTGISSFIPLNSWILDTGATHHVCHNETLFESFESTFVASYVTLPNGQSASIDCVGRDISRAVQIGKGSRVGNLYYLNISDTQVHSTCFSDSIVPTNETLWHFRLGHPSCIKIHPLNKDLLFGSCSNDDFHCSICHFAKQKQAKLVIPKFFRMIKTQFGVSIKAVRSDNAKELALDNFFSSNGVIHYRSCVERLEQNSVVERKHQHLLNVSRALLFQSNVPLAYWGDCVLTATYLINRTPSILLKNKSPFEILYGKSPEYNHLRAFGCLCYASTLLSARDKFSPRSKACIFLGYPSGMKGYKLLDIESRRFFVSHHLSLFDNTVLPLPISDSDLTVQPVDANPIDSNVSSPPAQTRTTRLLLALASINGWFLYQLDVNNTFLHGDLDEEVYMTIPPGYSPTGGGTVSNAVCRLHKSLYGLKQASRQWYAKFSNTLLANNFKQSATYHSLFI
ncbi:hypothetical protein UlMin_029614 [Ulmus minor]